MPLLTHRRFRSFSAVLLLGAAVLALACGSDQPGREPTQDEQLLARLAAAGVTPLPPAPSADPALVQLGGALFFDKLLSGNKDIGCSTCHWPVYRTTDFLNLSIGTGGHHTGPGRSLGTGRFIPRHAFDLFNRGVPGWTGFFWDGRVQATESGFKTPAGAALPAGLRSLLAAQAMFPVAGRDEMRGHAGDLTSTGEPNELAGIADGNFPAIWRGLMTRILAVPEYRSLFAAAYPTVPAESLGFQHAANAIAEFVSVTWRADASPFDRYLAGDHDALPDSAKRGALLFYGKGRCSACHSGPQLTDMRYHNIAVPDLGPGFEPNGRDEGRARVTGLAADRFAFRTPALRNVVITAPYMHDGAYQSLDQVLHHYLNPTAALSAYDGATLDSRLKPSLHADAATIHAILATLDPLVATPLPLTEADLADLRAFLFALTDPASISMIQDIPATVPSGLSVFDY